MANVERQMAAGGGFAGRSAAEYERAVRHSRRVSLMKLLLPTIAFGIIIALVAVSILFRALPGHVSAERASVANDGTIVMDNPVLTGQTGEAQTFVVNAEEALQNVGSPNIITLRTISAELPVSEDETVSVEATSGVYDRGNETLTLDEPFRVTSSGGLEVEMQSAVFDFSEGGATSDSPVAIRNGNTTLVARTVRMRDNGETIIFEHDVRMTIDPSTLRNSQEDDE